MSVILQNVLVPKKMNFKDLEAVNYMEKLVIYLEKGSTKCEDCPFCFYDTDGEYSCGNPINDILDCYKFDLSSIKESDEI